MDYYFHRWNKIVVLRWYRYSLINLWSFTLYFLKIEIDASNSFKDLIYNQFKRCWFPRTIHPKQSEHTPFLYTKVQSLYSCNCLRILQINIRNNKCCILILRWILNHIQYFQFLLNCSFVSILKHLLRIYILFVVIKTVNNLFGHKVQKAINKHIDNETYECL